MGDERARSRHLEIPVNRASDAREVSEPEESPKRFQDGGLGGDFATRLTSWTRLELGVHGGQRPEDRQPWQRRLD